MNCQLCEEPRSEVLMFYRTDSFTLTLCRSCREMLLGNYLGSETPEGLKERVFQVRDRIREIGEETERHVQWLKEEWLRSESGQRDLPASSSG